jgi:hypothetical protein
MPDISTGQPELRKLSGLVLKLKELDDDWIGYDIGKIALHSLYALQIAVAAIEQIVTGETLVRSLDVGDFYANLGKVIGEETGDGILSEPGSVDSLKDELDGIIDIVKKARECGRAKRGERAHP